MAAAILDTGSIPVTSTNESTNQYLFGYNIGYKIEKKRTTSRDRGGFLVNYLYLYISKTRIYFDCV